MKTIINNIEIKAITSYLPEKKLELSSLSNIYGEQQVEYIIKNTGIKEVHIANEDETAADLCYKAAINLINQHKINIEDIDGLIFVSQTPDYILPSTSVVLQDRLGLSKNTVCIDINYGCSGYIYGIFQAASWINCNACKNVLVLVGDTITKLVNPNDKSLRMVFGDAGTASLVSSGESSMGFVINSDGSDYDKLIVPAGAFRLPISEKTNVPIEDDDKNIRTLENIYMDGMAIFNFAITKVHKNINENIELREWDKNDIGLFALHQANKFMVNYIGKKLKVKPELVPVHIENYGNTGPATIPLLLSELGDKYNTQKTILSGFGVGLSWGSISTDLSNTKFYKPLK